jgi:hypothetical protein
MRKLITTSLKSFLADEKKWLNYEDEIDATLLNKKRKLFIFSLKT